MAPSQSAGDYRSLARETEGIKLGIDKVIRKEDELDKMIDDEYETIYTSSKSAPNGGTLWSLVEGCEFLTLHFMH